MQRRITLLCGAWLAAALLASSRLFAQDWPAVERQIGQIALKDLALRYGIVREPALQDWLERIMAPLAAQATRRLTFQLVILGSYENNAFSLPGGYICVTRGLLCHVSSDEELAGVLAHEIAHLEHYDFQRLFRQQALYIVGQSLLRGHANDALLFASQILQLLDGLRLQRRHEAEADRLAVALTVAAGYDPEGVVAFLKPLVKRRASRGMGRLFATHPTADARLAAAQKEIARIEEREPERFLAIGDSLWQRGHGRAALAVYERLCQANSLLASVALARAAQIKAALAPPPNAPILSMTLAAEEQATLQSTLHELRLQEEQLYQGERRLYRALQAYEKDKEIARAWELAQIIGPDITDPAYITTLARAYYALSASWNTAVRLGEIISRSGTIRTVWERSAEMLYAGAFVPGGTEENLREWRQAWGQFSVALSALQAATSAVGQAAAVAYELSNATRMLAAAFIALVGSGEGMPLGRLNFTRFSLLQADIWAAEQRIRRVAQAAQQTHSVIVKGHLEALAEQIQLLHATAWPTLRAHDERLCAQRLALGLRPEGPLPPARPRATTLPMVPEIAALPATSLETWDILLRMLYLDMRAERENQGPSVRQ